MTDELCIYRVAESGTLKIQVIDGKVGLLLNIKRHRQLAVRLMPALTNTSAKISYGICLCVFFPRRGGGTHGPAGCGDGGVCLWCDPGPDWSCHRSLVHHESQQVPSGVTHIKTNT